MALFVANSRYVRFNNDQFLSTVRDHTSKNVIKTKLTLTPASGSFTTPIVLNLWRLRGSRILHTLCTEVTIPAAQAIAVADKFNVTYAADANNPTLDNKFLLNFDDRGRSIAIPFICYLAGSQTGLPGTIFFDFTVATEADRNKASFAKTSDYGVAIPAGAVIYINPNGILFEAVVGPEEYALDSDNT